MVPFFVQIKCKLGQSYTVANALAEAEIASEIYSTAGHYDLLVKFYVDNGHRHRSLHQREGAGHSRHPGHPHHHHLQGVRHRLAAPALETLVKQGRAPAQPIILGRSRTARPNSRGGCGDALSTAASVA